MKLLILAQTPPPLHGQSAMVRVAVEGLPKHGIEVHHVNLRLSRSQTDIGGWRPGKILAILDACFHAVATRFAHECDTLYYVPAPGKRGAIYRDWLVMLLVRPFFPRLVLHFHNGGLGDWLEHSAQPWERALTRWFLRDAALAIVLAESLRPDAVALQPRRVAVVPNGIAIGPDAELQNRPHEGFASLYLGQCSVEKGVLDAVAAVRRANARAGGRRFRLTIAGECVDGNVARALEAAERESAGLIRHIGFADDARKIALWAEHDCLLLPTRYAHEGQPLVVLEALAQGRPVVATKWRAIPAMLPPGAGILVEPGDIEALAEALPRLAASPADAPALRRHAEEDFSLARHLEALAAALRSLDTPRR